MKLFDTLLFSFAILMMLIGIHQAMMFGFHSAYWLFMLCLSALLWYQIRKKNQSKGKDGKNAASGSEGSGSQVKKRKYKM